MRSAVLCLVNQRRGSRGLPLLHASARLDTSAQNWTNAMVATGNFTHGSNFAGRFAAVGYYWQYAGENIATGYRTPRDVVSAWMASTGHCENILDPHYRDIGIGENPRPVGSFATHAASWTQDFGLLMSQSPPSGNTGPMNGCPY